jgi:hypothetical protein
VDVGLGFDAAARAAGAFRCTPPSAATPAAAASSRATPTLRLVMSNY